MVCKIFDAFKHELNRMFRIFSGNNLHDLLYAYISSFGSRGKPQQSNASC